MPLLLERPFRDGGTGFVTVVEETGDCMVYNVIDAFFL
jgi:hypothetical protein